MSPIQPCSFSRLDRQRNRCSRRLTFCQRVFVFGTVLKLSVSRQLSVLVECSWFTHLLGQMCCCARKVSSASGHGPRSHAGRSVSCCIFLLERWTLPSVIQKLVLQFLSRCACCFFVRVALNVSDDEWCVSQVKLDFQEALSSLICRHSEHLITLFELFTKGIRTDAIKDRGALQVSSN